MLWIGLGSSVKAGTPVFHSFILKECLLPALPVIFHGLSDAGGFNPTSVRRQLCGAGLRQGVVCICQFILSC